jgi:hypothetical protein
VGREVWRGVPPPTQNIPNKAAPVGGQLLLNAWCSGHMYGLPPPCCCCAACCWSTCCLTTASLCFTSAGTSSSHLKYLQDHHQQHSELEQRHVGESDHQQQSQSFVGSQQWRFVSICLGCCANGFTEAQASGSTPTRTGGI